MKKLISLFSAISVGISSLCMPTDISAVESKGNLLVLGDSISSGYGLDTGEYNYGEIVADYLDYDVNNLAVSGITTSDLLGQLSGNDFKTAVADADMIVISIGGNDFIQSALEVFEANYGDIGNISDISQIFELFQQDQMTALTILNNLYSTVFPQVCNEAISNISEISSTISALNPDAVVMFQNIYDPFQINQSIYDSYISSNSTYKAGYIGIKRTVYYNVCTTNTYSNSAIPVSFNVKIKDAVGSAQIIDVYDSFTSDTVPESDLTQPYGNAFYFTDIFADERDFHPNQKGHLEIASLILESVGAEPVSSQTIKAVYNGLTETEKALYPSARFEVLKNYAEVADISTILKGDYNNDGVVNASDASEVLAYYAASSSGANPVISDEIFEACDMNDDGVLNASDASEILAYYAQISSGGGN